MSAATDGESTSDGSSGSSNNNSSFSYSSILVVLLAAAIGAFYHQSNSNNASVSCFLVPDIAWMLTPSWHATADTHDTPLNSSTSQEIKLPPVNTCSAFFDTYLAARQTFRLAATALNATITPLLIAPSSPEEEGYTMDIAVIPGSLPGIAVHVSGTHGIEGYTGSAIQVAFMNALLHQHEQQTDGARAVIPMCTVILVHAFNPVGMAKYRRFNEHNVDLNRNGLSKDEWEHPDQRHWNAATYNKFAPLFSPASSSSTDTTTTDSAKKPYVFSWWDVRVISWGRIIWAVLNNGVLYLKKAIVGGQYHAQHGIFYGGARTEPSLLVLREWMATFLQGYHQGRDTAAAPKPVLTWIDVHTGLGPMGVDTLLPSPMKEQTIATDIRHWFPDASWHDDKAVSAGYENTLGRTIDYFQLELNLTNDLFFAQEFGTRHPILVAHAMIMENTAFHAPSLSETERLQWSKDLMGAAFYPSNQRYRSEILKRGLCRLQQAIQRSVHLSSPTLSKGSDKTSAA